MGGNSPDHEVGTEGTPEVLAMFRFLIWVVDIFKYFIIFHISFTYFKRVIFHNFKKIKRWRRKLDIRASSFFQNINLNTSELRVLKSVSEIGRRHELRHDSIRTVAFFVGLASFVFLNY